MVDEIKTPEQPIKEIVNCELETINSRISINLVKKFKNALKKRDELIKSQKPCHAQDVPAKPTYTYEVIISSFIDDLDDIFTRKFEIEAMSFSEVYNFVSDKFGQDWEIDQIKNIEYLDDSYIYLSESEFKEAINILKKYH